MSKSPEEVATEITVAYIQAMGQIGTSHTLISKDAMAQYYETIYRKTVDVYRDVVHGTSE